jgi:hypothetical protein
MNSDMMLFCCLRIPAVTFHRLARPLILRVKSNWDFLNGVLRHCAENSFADERGSRTSPEIAPPGRRSIPGAFSKKNNFQGEKT